MSLSVRHFAHPLGLAIEVAGQDLFRFEVDCGSLGDAVWDNLFPRSFEGSALGAKTIVGFVPWARFQSPGGGVDVRVFRGRDDATGARIRIALDDRQLSTWRAGAGAPREDLLDPLFRLPLWTVQKGTAVSWFATTRVEHLVSAKLGFPVSRNASALDSVEVECEELLLRMSGNRSWALAFVVDLAVDLVLMDGTVEHQERERVLQIAALLDPRLVRVAERDLARGVSAFSRSSIDGPPTSSQAARDVAPASAPRAPLAHVSIEDEVPPEAAKGPSASPQNRGVGVPAAWRDAFGRFLAIFQPKPGTRTKP
jgi:hypothetical protein